MPQSFWILSKTLPLKIDSAPERVAFVTVEEDQPGGRRPPAEAAAVTGRTSAPSRILDRKKDGVKFSDVQPGSPAAKAGFKAGDVLVQFGAMPIQ